MTTQAHLPKIKRDYKSRLFVMIFSDKKELLSLYNAMSGRHYDDPEALTINTLENAIYMSMRNDVSFIIDSRLSLYEHQSTYNPNMPLRIFFYLSDLYSTLTMDENLYGSKQIKLPAPRFVVFYNGTDERPEYEELKLSDMYIMKDERISLELLVDVFNINTGHNEELLAACRTLHDYAVYTSRVRQYAGEVDVCGDKIRTIEEAVEQAITECIREGILKEFLEQNRTEAMHMSIYEYDEEKHMRMEREYFYAEGHRDGHQAGLTEGHRAGLAEGRAERDKLFCLIDAMTLDNQVDSIPRLAKDPDFYTEMLKKYNL